MTYAIPTYVRMYAITAQTFYRPLYSWERVDDGIVECFTCKVDTATPTAFAAAAAAAAAVANINNFDSTVSIHGAILHSGGWGAHVCDAFHRVKTHVSCSCSESECQPRTTHRNRVKNSSVFIIERFFLHVTTLHRHHHHAPPRITTHHQHVHVVRGNVWIHGYVECVNVELYSRMMCVSMCWRWDASALSHSNISNDIQRFSNMDISRNNLLQHKKLKRKTSFSAFAPRKASAYATMLPIVPFAFLKQFWSFQSSRWNHSKIFSQQMSEGPPVNRRKKICIHSSA